MSHAWRRPHRWAALVVGAALALLAIIALNQVSDRANAQSAEGAGFTLSVEQLQINQRISQAGVRRANESLELLDPIRGSGSEGWDTAQLAEGAVTGSRIADGTITASKLAPGVLDGDTGQPPPLAPGSVGTDILADGAVTEPKIAPGAVSTSRLADGAVSAPKLSPELAARLPLWAVVQANGTLLRGNATSATRINAGNYRVEFAGRDLTTCGFSGVQNEVTAFLLGDVGIEVANNDATRLFVRTTNANGDSADRDFSVQVTC